MTFTCAVADCPNTKKTKSPDLIFHRFPVRNKKMCKVWMVKCKREKLNPMNNRVCSDHFVDDDYERDMKNELLQLPLKRRLKKTAFPTRFKYRKANNKNVGDEKCAVERSQRLARRRQQEIVAELLADFDRRLELHKEAEWQRDASENNFDLKSDPIIKKEVESKPESSKNDAEVESNSRLTKEVDSGSDSSKMEVESQSNANLTKEVVLQPDSRLQSAQVNIFQPQPIFCILPTLMPMPLVPKVSKRNAQTQTNDETNKVKRLEDDLLLAAEIVNDLRTKLEKLRQKERTGRLRLAKLREKIKVPKKLKK